MNRGEWLNENAQIFINNTLFYIKYQKQNIYKYYIIFYILIIYKYYIMYSVKFQRNPTLNIYLLESLIDNDFMWPLTNNLETKLNN